MATEKILAFRNFLRKLEQFNQYELTDADAATIVGDLVDADVTGKADKVAGAVAGNFAGLDANGNLTDSGKNTNSFALKAHTHDTRYLRLDASNTFDLSLSGGITFTFSVTNEAPFIISNGGGDILPEVTHLNADLLDGKHAASFSLSNHRHEGVYPKFYAAQTETILAEWTFDRAGTGVAPFLVAADNSGVVTNLNADKLDGSDASAFAVAAHTHAWGTITGTLSAQTDLNTALGLKLAKPTAGAGDGTILVWDGAGEVQTSPSLYSELALKTDIATKANMVTGATVNRLAKLVLDVPSGKYDIADSGYLASDFAVADHTHDDRYFTETELTDNSTNLALANLDVGGTLELTTVQAAGAQAGTISNVHTAGNPNIFFKVIYAGGNYAVPGWTIP